MEPDPSRDDLDTEIETFELDFEKSDPRLFRFWETARVEPALWRQTFYIPELPVWVIGLIGRRCLCYNPVEGGWGWGSWTEWGTIDVFHCDLWEVSGALYNVLYLEILAQEAS